MSAMMNESCGAGFVLACLDGANRGDKPLKSRLNIFTESRDRRSSLATSLGISEGRSELGTSIKSVSPSTKYRVEQTAASAGGGGGLCWYEMILRQRGKLQGLTSIQT